jgi:hypothetical protein
MLTNSAGSSAQTLGGVTSMEISDTMPLKSEVSRLQREGGYGGKFNFGKMLRSVGRAIMPIARMARPLVKYIPGYGEAIDRGLTAFGAGHGEDYGGAYDCPPQPKRSLRDYF